MAFWSEKRSNYILGLRMFIEGVEVTEYLTGSVNISYGSTNAFNTASFTIANPNSLFLITDRNLQGQYYRKEKFKKELQEYREKLKAKGAWDSNEGAPIFRYRDSVRIFERTHTNNQRWRHVFTGCLTGVTPSTSIETGESSLNINCGDIREPIMGRKRFQSNKVTGEVKPEYMDTESTSLFKDILYDINQENTHIFAGMSFENTLSILLTGAYQTGPGLAEYPGAAPLGQISRPREFFRMKSPYDISKVHDLIWSESMVYDEVTYIGENTKNDGLFSPFGPDVTMNVVLPNDGLGIKNLTEYSVQEMGSQERAWETFLGMINSLCGRIEYQFHIHPNGQIMFEPILYDHVPNYFGKYKDCFYARAHLKDNLNIVPDPQSIVTSLVVTGGCANTNTPNDMGTVRQPRVAVYSKEMQRLYGINNEEMDFPFTQDQNNLKLFACIEWQKRLRAVSTLETGIAYRPGLWLNRPMDINEKYLGRINNLSFSYNVNESVDMTVELDSIRFLGVTGEYEYVTGLPSGMINWSGIFGKDSITNSSGRLLWMAMDGKERKLTENIT